jgi:hypothetical protein
MLSGAAMPGFRVVRDVLTVSLFAGAVVQDYRLSPYDPSSRLHRLSPVRCRVGRAGNRDAVVRQFPMPAAWNGPPAPAGRWIPNAAAGLICGLE